MPSPASNSLRRSLLICSLVLISREALRVRRLIRLTISGVALHLTPIDSHDTVSVSIAAVSFTTSKQAKTAAREPLFGFIPRHVQGRQIRKALDHNLNPFTKKPHSAQYKAILNMRKKLPVYEQMDSFLEIFNRNQIMIIVGETGSGSQFVAFSDLPHTRGKMVACTQPRRVAAMSIAKRVSDEMDVELGRQVGYSVRFEDMIEPGTTFLKYMTDGMLLREAMNDNTLAQYSTIILDEAHERTLATDILMGLLKDLAKRRFDLKIIVMSATLDAVKFQKYFSIRSDSEASLFKVPGRTHPVEVFYTQEPEKYYVEAAIRTRRDACRKIKIEADDIASQDPDSVGPLVCIPLYSSLTPQQLQRIFDPALGPSQVGGPSGRKVVVATSIAETSLSIDGIVFVVDPGFSKQKELEEKTDPEILCSNLAGTVLELVNLGIKDLLRFDYVDPPAPETLMRALELLNFLAAIDDEGNLTALGKLMADFPLDPQLSKLLIASPDFKCSNEILTITAMLSVPNVWLRPNNQRREADAAKEAFTVPESDHLTLLNVFNQYMLNKHDRNWAWSNYISARALAQAENVRQQLQRIMERLDIDLVTTNDQVKLFTNIRKALVCGFFMQVAHKEGEKGSYFTVKDNQPVELHPSCGLKTQPEPEWLLENARLYYDLESFPDGETKRALKRVHAKKYGLVESRKGSLKGTPVDEPAPKRRKTRAITQPNNSNSSASTSPMDLLKATTRAIRSVRNYLLSLRDESTGTIRANFRAAGLGPFRKSNGTISSQRDRSDPLARIRRSALEFLSILRAVEEKCRIPLSDEAYDAQSDGGGSRAGAYLTVKDNQAVGLHPSCGLKTHPEPEWLLENARLYFDLDSFPNGETKRALKRVQAKKFGLEESRNETSRGRSRKGGKRKKNRE
ncbi:hypothetical protein Agabi119p4_10634 [Agaricus bisporus var. burnettii]|uniref:RNA helicase n=1 Tax=Agaricus bisporus var. burnettii TaxID=192524 RepID=A0A8H7C3A0_AGABI|nr:hypothetical protein Agabi119p4_10634 [Agaricus bisporus var. burnettii]